MEVALLARIVDLIVDRSRVYDLIIFDTAPTGHTLQLPRMPDAINTWIQALVRHRRAVLEIDRGLEQPTQPPPDEDPVLIALERRRERPGRLRTVLADRHRTSFVLVMVPERMVIEETARAAVLLEETGIDVGGLLINRVLPDGLTGEFFVSRKAQEREYLQEIERRFPRLPRVRVLQLSRDVHGLDTLQVVASQLVP